MSSELLPGRSVRPQPSRNKVSPLTRRPPTWKHWLPGVCPGVWISVTSIDADPHDVAGIVDGEVVVANPGGALHPRHFVSLHVNGAIDAFEQRGDALDGVAHHRSADVVGVVVRREHAAHGHAVGGHSGDHIVDCVGRIDQEAFARRSISDRVDEVDHLLGDGIVESRSRDPTGVGGSTADHRGSLAIRRTLASDEIAATERPMTRLTQLVEGQLLVYGGDRVTWFPPNWPAPSPRVTDW